MKDIARTHRHKPPHLRALVARLSLHLAISLALLGASLAIGMLGYGYFEGMGPRDAFLNAAMILGGMGPVKTDFSPDGKIFAGLYALFSGLVIVGVTGLLLTPGVHFVMKLVHWQDHTESE